ncbi:MAG: DNA ligase D [Pseudomonadota bacterium]
MVQRKPDPLALYNAKRDFSKTAEPAGTLAPGHGNSFMVQKHDATRLHWDLRLEVDGVLKSWAVTRGPSLDPAEKRLAVRTEDHPLSYATFEGTIPAKEYGGGTVMLWDRGTWSPIAGKSAKDIEHGHLHFVLDGERMKGEWILIRLKPRGNEKRENWLLRKIDDADAGGTDTLVETALTSVKTGRTMQEIAEGKKAKPLPAPKTSSPPRRGPSSTSKSSGTAREMGSRVRGNDVVAFQPLQLCTLVDSVPAGSAWLHEVKYDGYRALIAVANGKAKVYTRTGLDWTAKFQKLADLAAALPVQSALLDGEIVAFKGGKPDFSTLKDAISNAGEMTFFAFDLLANDGADLTQLPLVERKARLQPLLIGTDAHLQFSDHIAGSGEALFETMCREGYEGVVSKLADAPYAGKRTKGWVKTKCTRRQEFVIVGWTDSDKSRGFRALLLGAKDESGKLIYAGKVGTGFDMATMLDLQAKLKKLEQKTPTVTAPRDATRKAHWVKPELVAEVAYAEVTPDGVLRHSSFLGLRGDKPADEVVFEHPSTVRPEPVEGRAANGVGATRASTSSARTDAGGVKISSRDRIIDETGKVTKGDLADYYAAVAPIMLPWLANRPVSLVRCPQGRAKHCFFQKHDAGSFGDTVHKVPVKEKDGSTEDYLYVTDVAGILSCVQMGTIEFHGWGSSLGPPPAPRSSRAKSRDVPQEKASRLPPEAEVHPERPHSGQSKGSKRTEFEGIEKPDRMVFDLDPDEGLDFEDTKKAADFLKNQLAELGLTSFPLLSGGKGVHVVVPLTPQATWPQVKDFADRFARALAAAEPDRFVATMSKAKRVGRIFIDYLRNQRGSTAILPYAARARPNTPVAAPVSWTELRDLDTAARWTVKDAAELLERAGSRALEGWGVADQVLPDL